MKVMANSIPKGGTHLIIKLLNLLGYEDEKFWVGADLIRGRGEFINRIIRGSNSKDAVTIGSEVPVKIGSKWLSGKLGRLKDGSVFGAHCLYSNGLNALLRDNDIKVVCIIRDPRSIAMSHLHYIKKSSNHFFYNDYMKLPTDLDRLKLTILGGKLGKYSLQSLNQRYQDYMNWANNNAIVVKFEDLVGEKGGGNDEAQTICIKQVAEFLEIDLADVNYNCVQQNLFGDSSTFRQGKARGWEDELDNEILQIMSNEITDVLISLGYETDENWMRKYLHS